LESVTAFVVQNVTLSFAVPVLAVHMEAVFAWVEANERNALHDGLPK
jgi:hypothetical protein